MTGFLNHKDFSGYFPFDLLRYQDLPVRTGFNSQFSLEALTRAYWLSKTVEISASVGYSWVETSSGGVVDTYSSSGVGSLSIDLSGVSPQQRVDSTGFLPNPAGTGGVVPGTFSWTESIASPGGPIITSDVLTDYAVGGWEWFVPFFQPYLGYPGYSQNLVALDSTLVPPNYYTYMYAQAILASVATEFNSVSSPNVSQRGPDFFQIKIGTEMVVLPGYTQYNPNPDPVDPESSYSQTITGGIVMDFTDFF